VGIIGRASSGACLGYVRPEEAILFTQRENTQSHPKQCDKMLREKVAKFYLVYIAKFNQSKGYDQNRDTTMQRNFQTFCMVTQPRGID